METLTDRIITIARFSNNRALLLQSRLQAEGIDCFLAHQNLLQAAVAMGVEIKVRESDVDRALRLIELYREESGKQKEKAVKAMHTARRILVPVDFSDASLRAVKLAISLADELKAEIKLLHVFYNPVLDVAPFDTSHTYQINLTRYLHEIEQNARKQLADLVCEAKKMAEKAHNKIKINSSLSNGIADEEILAVSKRNKPGLVIMGSKGMGHQSEGLFGSMAVKVVAKSTVPVIAVPESSKLTAVNKLKNILYATDFDDYDQIALSRLIDMVHPFKPTLHIVHVSIGVKKAWDKPKMDLLKKFLSSEFTKYPVKYKIVVSDDVINGLECYMRNNDIEVVALTNHTRNAVNRFFSPSVTRMIMQRINRPLFIVKANGK